MHLSPEAIARLVGDQIAKQIHALDVSYQAKFAAQAKENAELLELIAEKAQPAEPDNRLFEQQIKDMQDNYDRLVEELPELIKAAYPETIKGDKGDKGDMPLASEVADYMVNSEVLASRLKRYIDENMPEPIKGDPGDSFDEDWAREQVSAEVKAQLPDDWSDYIPEPIKGEPGKDAPAVDTDVLRGEVISDLLDKLPDMIKHQIPDPIKGDKGDPGVDRPVFDPQVADDDQPVAKHVFVGHNGGLWMATRKSKGTPTQDPGSFMLIVNGLASVESIQLDERTVQTTHTLSDGTEKKTYINTGAVVHKGLWKVHGDYDVNDETMLNGSTWRCINAGTKARPGDNGDWKLATQSKPGKKGDKGDSVKGDPGRGIKDMFSHVVDGERKLVIKYDDGTEEVRDIEGEE